MAGEIIWFKVYLYSSYNLSTVNANFYLELLNENSRPDYRTALYWEPNLILDGRTNEIKISFYNSDVAKKFKIVLEGITDDGRPIHFEKIVQ